MNSRKVLLSILLITVLSLTLVACNTPSKEPTPLPEIEAPTEPENIQEDASGGIAVIVKITGIPWFDRMEEGVVEAAEDLGVNAFQVGPADADPAEQLRIVEDMISKGVKAIAVIPNDANALAPILEKAQEAGIIVLTHESPNQVGSDYDIELIDNVEFGQYHWDKLVESMGDTGEYAIFVGGLSVPLHNLWANEGLAYAAKKYPNLKFVAGRIPCGEDEELSKEKTLQLLEDYPDLKGIVGFGSMGPIGAAQILREKGLIDDIAVVGTVLPGQAAPYLKDGSMDYGILWDPKDAGYSVVWTAVQLMDGKDISDGMEVPGIGVITLDGNVIKVDAMLDITAENAEDLGF